MSYNILISKTGETLAVDFDAMPEHVKAHIIEYGLKQKLNDAHSQHTEKSDPSGYVEKSRAAAAKCLENLMAGELRANRASSALAGFDLAFVTWAIAHKAKLKGLHEAFGGKEKLVEFIGKETNEPLIDLLCEKLNANDVGLRKGIESWYQAEMARRAAEAKQNADLASSLNLNL